ncbi:hypothetical protein EYC87_08355 [Halieaceae bacterium IMCC8485]|uniref:Sulfotransferase family protein n=1 Tax=Candidatus Seongchinamella marina TaxID=2518990 RepID=A0ABT3SWB2_9GAMM|nr:hypothetical protein [Candidatus Seongchinamella marina]MCX2973589.1 hypothetical protein [Candidatus Seongchinamella marina]
MILIIMPWGRVGSNLINSILSQHLKPINGCVYNEPTTGLQTRNRGQGAQAIAVAQARWWETFAAECEENSAIAANVSIASIEEVNWFISCVEESTAKVIYLDRINVVKTAVSSIKAQQYSRHSEKMYGKPSWEIPVGREPLKEFYVDPEQLVNSIQRLERHRANQRRLQSLCPGLNINYEELAPDIPTAIRRITDYLKIPAREYKINSIKATANDLQNEIINFSEVLDRLPVDYQSQLLAK